jgi:tellurite resistance protein
MRIHTATIARLRDSLLQSGRRPSIIMSPAYETLARSGLLSPEETIAIERVDPLAETMYLMMVADGHISDVERDAIRGAIRGLAGNLIRTGTINVMLETFAGKLHEHGREVRLREIAEALSDYPHEAEGAFSLAAAIALADDSVRESENELINQLAECFGIPLKRANEILDELSRDRETTESPV